MDKFKLQIVGTLSSIIIAIVTVLVYLSYNSFKSESVSLTKLLLKEKSHAIEIELAEKFNSYKRILSSVKLSEEDFENSSLSFHAISQLNSISDIQKDVSDGNYIFRKNGDIFDNAGNKLNINVKKLNRSYHDALFNKGASFYVTTPYNSAATGEQIISVAYKVSSDSAVLSAINVDAVLGSLSNQSDMFLFSHDGTLLSTPYKELIGENIFDHRPMYRQFSSKQPELTYTAKPEPNGDNVDFTAFWGRLDINGWQYVVFARNSVIEQHANSQLSSSLIIGVVSLGIAIVILLLTINKLVLKPVGGAPEDIAQLMEKMATGDLTQYLAATGKDTGIYLSLINLSNELSRLIKSSHQISDNVSSASQELNAVMNDTLGHAETELTQVEQISTAITQLSSTSLEVSDKAVMAEEETRKAMDNVSNGKLTLEKNVILTDKINTSFTETANIVEELREYAVEIGAVTEMINSISEQTNLLALNAAIEAARAGEAGRGFAVVADEVRELASKTQSSTVSIQEIISKLQSQSEKANENMGQNVDLISESVSLVEGIKASFEDISTAVHSISDINAIVATASQQQQAVTEDISKNATQAFDMVHQNVSAANQTLQASSELSQLAETQHNELAFFKV
ncbi:methyl-accepting chemotaxis protein [Vibrio hannami]|uniref:methyl-accepting chemotaxis protein n=1 Tax=Vibrio hannami TaxID=2717094 RepID=UPI00240EA47E|nr:methyl-accepting chemotaxis protein [Vibrio hannami]MDG3085887.1 methyl-accepting chemotaxis protein [Vibrio hannami]